MTRASAYIDQRLGHGLRASRDVFRGLGCSYHRAGFRYRRWDGRLPRTLITACVKTTSRYTLFIFDNYINVAESAIWRRP